MEKTAGIPFLSDLPVVSRLFASTGDNEVRNEIILLITPRVVRNLVVPGPSQLEIVHGTEASTGAGSLQLGTPASRSAPAAGSQGMIPPLPAVVPQGPANSPFAPAPAPQPFTPPPLIPRAPSSEATSPQRG